MKELTYKANDVLKKLFDDAGLILVDFKLEFGLYKGEVVLGDEFSPDGRLLRSPEIYLAWLCVSGLQLQTLPGVRHGTCRRINQR